MALSRSKWSPALALLLGGAAAAALLAAASLDFGDPLSAARNEVLEVAALDLALVEGSIEEGLGGSGSAAAALAAAGTWMELPGSSGPAPTAPADLPISAALALVQSADIAAARGALAEAVHATRDALQAASNDAERVLVHLAAARYWSQLGSDLDVDVHRRRLLELDADPTLEGTSAKLLACLVAPADAEAALHVLGQGAPLPPAQDRVVTADGRLSVQWDPWRRAIRSALEECGADPGALDAVLNREDRRARAYRNWTLATFDEISSSWSIHSLEGGQAAFARILAGDQIELCIADQRSAWRALTEHDVSRRTRLDIAVTGPDEEPFGESVAGPLSVPGLLGSLHIVHPDPEAGGRAEARRLAILRWALVGLAAAILGASVLAARTAARARRLAALRSTFVASVSHDLRTPVQGILLMAETLEDGRLHERAPERLPRYHSRIRREALRLRRLVEDLLDGARIDRGDGARIEREEVALGRWMDELEAAMAERATAAEAELRFERGDLPSHAHIDPFSAHRALWNVFENALIHGKSDDGRCSVRVSLRAEAGALVAHICDDGAGIPVARQRTIFEPFERLQRRGRAADTADPDRDTGTGLGLAIVRALCRAHGGDASIVPSPSGATFELRFAAAITASPSQSPTP